MNSAVEEIKSRLDIVDYIGQYIRLNKAGANWKANCPFHNEHTPSFMVSEEKQIWHCFGCQKGGDIFGFLMEMESLDFKDALKVLAEKAGVELPKYQISKAQTVEKDKTHEILELATKFYETQLWQGSGKIKILDYLHTRGLKDEALKTFRIGYAPPGWRNLLDFLVKRGYKLSEVEKTGLLVKKDNSQISNNQFPISKQIPNSNDQNLKQVTDYQLPVTSYYDRFRDRITFPIADLMGKVIGFSARVAPGGDESQAKYVNTPETAIYHKSKIFYGIDKAKKEIKDKDEVVLVEGNTDVVAAHQAGAKNTIAVSGTALTPDQLDIIKRYTQNIKMFFDMDSAGQNAALRSAELALQKGLNVYIVESGAGKDAAEIISKDPKIFTDAVKEAKPAMEYFLKQIFAKFDKNNSMDKKKIASDGLEIVRHIGNEIERSHWLKIIAEELDVDFRVLADNLDKTEKEEKRFEKRVNEEDEFIGEERSDVIVQKIIGLMLAYPKVWKQVVSEHADESLLVSNSEFRILFENGEPCNFEIDKLLVIMEDERLRKTFQKLAFENRYRFSEDTGVEEADAEKVIEMVKSYLNELKKEGRKKKMKNILADIKKAEKEGNKEAVKILTSEFTNLSKDLK